MEAEERVERMRFGEPAVKLHGQRRIFSILRISIGPHLGGNCAIQEMQGNFDLRTEYLKRTYKAMYLYSGN